MEEIIKLAESVLEPNAIGNFRQLLESNMIYSCIMRVEEELKESLEELKKNAINDYCDPVITSRYKNAYNLDLKLRQLLK